MDNVMISVNGIAKRFRTGERGPAYKTFREAVTNVATAPLRRKQKNETPDYFWALKDITFDVKRVKLSALSARTGQVKHIIKDPVQDHRAKRGRGKNLR
jgi:hypothetical protein